jgi:hypothetical protein
MGSKRRNKRDEVSGVYSGLLRESAEPRDHPSDRLSNVMLEVIMVLEGLKSQISEAQGQVVRVYARLKRKDTAQPSELADVFPNEFGRAPNLLIDLISRGNRHRRVGVGTEPEAQPISRARAKGEEIGGYPKFIREDEKLVKIGWSPRKSKEYRHTCKFTDLLLFASRLSGETCAGGPAKLTEILPIKDSQGKFMDNCKIYTCLDWLQHTGLLKRHGKRGYAFEATVGLAGEIENRFRALPQRE